MIPDPFAAAGKLADTYRQVDWAATALGPVETWDPALRAALDLALNTRAPVTLFWGPEQVLLYNEAYVPMIGEKHPAALGATTRAVFAEIWDTIGPMLASVYAGEGATWVEDLRLLMDRHGFLEETYFTFSYSALHDEAGAVVGAIDIAAETTAQVLGRRRLELLSRLNDQLVDLEDVQQLLDHALPVLRSAPDDLPGVDILPPGTVLPVALDREVVVHGGQAWVRLIGVDAVLHSRLSPYLAVDPAYLGFFRLVGTALAQGLNRARTREAELRAVALERELSEALQRSLLAAPVQPAHVEVAVRYQPAAEGAHIGGDWYDCFQHPDSPLTVVVGDVTGHDREAAAAMSQLRNLLRGISWALRRPPARVLAELNDAMAGFGVDVFATALLAQLEPDGRTLHWSNAGHPPPMLVLPDGSVRLLESRPEPLLGTRSRAARTDHTVDLPPGSSLVLYTDGLIERRGATLDQGLRELTEIVRDRRGLSAEQICDLLLTHFSGATEDDVVLAVLRTGPVTGMPSAS